MSLSRTHQLSKWFVLIMNNDDSKQHIFTFNFNRFMVESHSKGTEELVERLRKKVEYARDSRASPIVVLQLLLKDEDLLYRYATSTA